MKIQDFEAELKLLNKDLSIRPNNAPARVLEHFPDVNKIASVCYCGVEICSIPVDEIFDEKNSAYGVDLRGDGRFIAHRTRPETLKLVAEKLEQLKNKEESDAFFGRGEYSDASLRKSDEKKGDITIVTEVPIDVQQIKGDDIKKIE